MKKKFKGSLTVETALIFPMVIFVILAMLFLILLLFSRINTSIAIGRICNEVEGTYYDAYGSYGVYADGASPSGGVITEAITEVLSSRSRKETAIENKLKKEIEKGSPTKLEIKPKVTITNCILWHNIEIEVEIKYPLPVGGIFAFFTGNDEFKSGTFKETQKRTLMVSSSESNIRTIDYTGEKFTQLQESSKVQEIIEKIKGKIGEIFPQ